MHRMKEQMTMITKDNGNLSSPPLQIPSSPGSTKSRIPTGSPVSRHASTARLVLPVTSKNIAGISQTKYNDEFIPGPHSSGDVTPLASVTPHSSLPGPGISALAAAFSNTVPQQSPFLETSPLHSSFPTQGETQPNTSVAPSNYGSFERSRSFRGAPGWAGPSTLEDPEIVKRHLVQPSEISQVDDSLDTGNQQITSLCDASCDGNTKQPNDATNCRGDDDEFSSLRLQGGDVTRPIYKWTEEAEARAQGHGRQGRSQSFHLTRPAPENDILDIECIKVPGGFRRNFIRRNVGSSPQNDFESGIRSTYGRRRFFTNSFIEFLTIYGHFAGEELDEDEESQEPSRYPSSRGYAHMDEENNEGDRDPTETSGLLTAGRRKRKERKAQGGSSILGASLLLLKSFIGTGVLFMPKAYLNGGMLFSNIVLVFVAALSYHCCVLLTKTHLKVEGSFGDMGGALYGNWLRSMILISIVISQIGFAATYFVFTSENLQAFIMAVSNGKTHISIPWLISMQLVVFLPFSLLRDISKLGLTALIADVLILFGILVLYYYDIATLVRQGGPADIVNFNPKDWALYIGTAIFTFEGIGLIIPIQETMKSPQKFPVVLGRVMIIIIAVYLSVGSISYAAFGSKTETVIILNLPQDDKLVNGVQFLYSIAILLSTPLQIFPAIRITENELFTRSGRHNPYIKWKKNCFRFVAVILCAGVAWLGAADLDKFVSLVGGFACVPLIYIYPVSLETPTFAKMF